MKQIPITINDEQNLDTYTVNFTHDYATISTTVKANDDNDAISLAENMLIDYYNFDLTKWVTDVFRHQ